MPFDPLPDDLDTLRALVISLASERDAAIAQCRRVTDANDRLHHLLRQLQRAQFGRRSERLDADQIELALEDIETTIAEVSAQSDKQNAAPADPQRKKRRANRGSLPAHLPASTARWRRRARCAAAVGARCTSSGRIRPSVST
jgi:transposase